MLGSHSEAASKVRGSKHIQLKEQLIFHVIHTETAAHSRLGTVSSTWRSSFILCMQLLSWPKLSCEHMQHMVAQAPIREVLCCQSNDLHSASDLVSNSAEKMQPTVSGCNLCIGTHAQAFAGLPLP